MYQVVHYPKDKSYNEYFYEMIDFLNKHYENHRFLHFHWSRWEWMFARGSFHEEDLKAISLFIKDEEIKGALIFEDDPNDAYFAVYDDDKQLKVEMIKYFKIHYPNKDIIIPEDDEMILLLNEIDHKKTDWIDPVTRFSLTSFDIPNTPEYEIISLAEDYRLDQIHHALYLGFNHGDDITYSKKDLEERQQQTSSPHFSKHYTFVAVSHDKYVSYVGIWYMKGTKTALIEPVATVPQHRKKYLARACIYAAIKAVKNDGAKDIFVGSNMDVYLNMGFKDFSKATRYKKKQ